MEAGIDLIPNIHNYMAAWGFPAHIAYTQPLSGAQACIKTGNFTGGGKTPL